MNHVATTEGAGERAPDLKDPIIPSAPLVPNFRLDRDTIPCPPPTDWDEGEGEQVS